MENFLIFFGVSLVILAFIYVPMKLRFRWLAGAHLLEQAAVDVFVLNILSLASALILGNILI